MSEARDRARRARSSRPTSTARRHGWTGDVPADGVAYVGRARPARRTRSTSTLTLRHPALGDVTNAYDDVLEWLRIVTG